jgi:hypothetical protein
MTKPNQLNAIADANLLLSFTTTVTTTIIITTANNKILHYSPVRVLTKICMVSIYYC